MNDSTAQVVTPRARSLVLRSTVDPNYMKTVSHGEQLVVVRQRPDGDVEVEYLQNHWRVPADAVEPWPQQRELTEPSGDRQASAGPRTATRAHARGRAIGRRTSLIIGAMTFVAVLCGLVLIAVLSRNGSEPEFRNLIPVATPAERAAEPAEPTMSQNTAPTQAVTGGGNAQLAPTGTVGALSPTTTPTVEATRSATATAVTATPAATTTTAPLSIAAFTVCDRTVDCGVPEGGHSRTEIFACMRATGGERTPSILLVATAGNEPPAAPDNLQVVARSLPILPDPVFTCYPVRSVRGELPNGRYTMWVLAGSTVLARGSFVIGP